MTTPMTYSQAGYNLTELSEACVLKSYKKKNDVWTIGWGHTLGVTAGMTCTREQAVQWLHEDIKTAYDAVNRYVHVPLTQGQFDALVDFVFNMGVGNFRDSLLLTMLNAGHYDDACQQLKRWVHQDGVVLNGLVTRRAAEIKMFSGA